MVGCTLRETAGSCLTMQTPTSTSMCLCEFIIKRNGIGWGNNEDMDEVFFYMDGMGCLYREEALGR